MLDKNELAEPVNLLSSKPPFPIFLLLLLWEHKLYVIFLFKSIIIFHISLIKDFLSLLLLKDIRSICYKLGYTKLGFTI